MLSKLMGLVTVGSAWAGTARLNRLLSGALNVVVLVIISALMCSFLLLGAFGAIYISLVHYGLDPYAAAITVAALMGVLTLTVVGVTVMKFRHLSDMSSQHIRSESVPGLSNLNSIVDAFLEGFNNARTSKAGKPSA